MNERAPHRFLYSLVPGLPVINDASSAPKGARSLPALLALLLLLACGSPQPVRSPAAAEAAARARCARADSLLPTDVTGALAEATEALAAAQQGRSQLGVAIALHRAGRCFDQLRRWSDATARYQGARSAALAAGSDSFVLEVTFNLAETYNNAGHNDSSLQYKLESLRLAQQLGKRPVQVQVMNYIGGYYFDTGRPQDAIAWWHRCFALLDPESGRYGRGMVHNNLAEAYLRLGRRDSAGWHLRRGMELAPSDKSPYVASYLQLTLANLHAPAHTDSAVGYSQRALAAARRSGDSSIAEKAQELLSELYRRQGNAGAALAAYRGAVRTRDSVRNSERHSREAAELVRYEFDRKLGILEKRRLLDEGDRRRNRTWLWLTGGTLLLVSLLSAGLALTLRQSRRRAAIILRQAQTLQEQKEELRGLLSDKELLIREVHHRVKNNLQVISGLLQLQSVRSQDASARSALEETQNRVLSIAFIHHNLYVHGGRGSVEMQSFLQELSGHMRSVFANDGVQVDIDVPRLELDIDTAVPLGLMINELLTNSFKYAFAGAPGQARIQLRATGPGTYLLDYRDSGPGLPEGLDPGRVRTLGLWLVRRLARQLGGSVHYSAPGTARVQIHFKDAAARGKETDTAHDAA